MQRTVIVMVKEPRPGRVKTRLGRDIGMTSAAWWFRHQSLSLLRRIRDKRWRVIVAVAPDKQGFASRIWPVDFDRVKQGNGDLGRRMQRALSNAPIGPVCLIGADVPGIGRQQIAEAFTTLARYQVVFGPATDGGFWLVGLRHPRLASASMFDSVRWSSEHALADSLENLSDRSIGFARTLQDVDTAEDLVHVTRGQS